MATIDEDYVSFEVAKLLRDKGFNEETEYVFSNNGELLRLNHFGIKDLTNADCNDYHTWKLPIEGVDSIISAPTLQIAMKWLRKAHNLVVNPVTTSVEVRDYGEWEVDIYYRDSGIDATINACGHIYGETYEKACNAGISYCLEYLI